MTGMSNAEIGQAAMDLFNVMQMAQVDPAKDSLVSAVDKFQHNNWRHLTLCLENGGMIFLCANAEMSRRLLRAIQEINCDMDRLQDDIRQTRGII